MKKTDIFKLNITRNWKFPGQSRLSRFLKPSGGLKARLHNGITWLSNEDICIYTTADNYLETVLLGTGTYEEEINKLIRTSLKPGCNALDIGGNIGIQSIRMSQAVGSAGKVLAFEPLGYLQKKFQKNIELNCITNIILFPFALSDAEAEIEFKIDDNIWNQGTFSLNSKAKTGETQKVLVKVGDDITVIQNLDSIALIKIDVEGFEYHVIRGLENSIIKHGPRIIFEYDSNYWVANNENITDCFQFLTDLHYRIYQITAVGCEMIKHPGEIVSGNLFCIRF